MLNEDNRKEPIGEETISDEAAQHTTSDFFRPCPICEGKIPMNERVCPNCGYYESKEGGYKPMSKVETKRIRTVLFIVLMGVAILVYVFLRAGS